ncbi:MAG: LysM peptidoglycan-binding domain-containing protein [Planctomycetota bacterium]|nr:LysM peptidoglycan-binding domain-containing protein [Planctomycetota bacterium]
MQPIERYGVAALLFLVVTIGAVVLWDQAESGGQAPSGTTEVAAAEKSPASKGLAGLSRSNVERPQPKLPDAPARAKHVAASEPTGPKANGNGWSTNRGVSLNERRTEPAPKADPIVARTLESSERKPEASSLGQKPGGLSGNLVQPNPASKPKAKPKPEPKPLRTYVVKSGDTMGQIAIDQLGTIKNLDELQAANPTVRPETMSVGTVLRLPELDGVDELLARKATPPAQPTQPEAAPTPKPSAGGSYTVVAGDSLWSIAAAKLGSGSRHAELAQLNPGAASVLKVGQVLRLPAGAASSTSSTKQPVAVASTSTQSRFPKGVVR